MKFRYQLSKETFKNKKIPPKPVDQSFLSEDQRVDPSKARKNLLSLDQETITPTEDQEDPKEFSRRDLFGLGKLSPYIDELSKVEDKREEVRKKKRKKKKKRVGKNLNADEAVAVESEDAVEAPAEKKGFFSRVKSWFKREKPQEQETPVSAEPAESVQENAILEEAPPPAPMSYEDSLTAITLPPEEEKEPIRDVKRISITLEEDNEEGEVVPEETVVAKESPPPVSKKKKAPKVVEEEEEEDDEPDPDDPELDRRNLIRQSFHFMAKPAVNTVQKKIDNLNNAVEKITKRIPLIRPPGAISEKAFLNACTRCDACIEACPKDAIKKVPKKFGFLIMGTPYIEPSKNPCVMCNTLPCISACQDEALLPAQSIFDVKMGYAILDKRNCQAYGETFCQQCVIDCPVPGAITQVNDQPVIHKKICTGCGVCVRSCGTVNIPVAIKIKPQMVIESQIRKKKREQLEAEQKAERKKAAQNEQENSEVESVS